MRLILKILIVDDDSIVRYGLKNAVDWTANGFEVVGEAANGQEALGMIGELRPDIVITDILMPIKTGIELIEETAEKYKDVFFLILSCYGEFEYVQKALRLGALDYLLKSTVVHGDELLHSLLDVKEKIIDVRSKDREHRSLTGLNTPAMVNRFLSAFVKGHIDNNGEIRDGLDELGLNHLSENYFLVGIGINDYYRIQSEYNKRDVGEQIDSKMIAVVGGVIKEYGHSVVFQADENWYVILIDMGGKSGLISLENKIISIAELIREKIDISLGYHINAYISSRMSIGGVAENYKKLVSASKHNVFLDENINIPVDAFLSKQTVPYHIETYADRLLRLLDQKDKFFEFLSYLFVDVAENSRKLRVFEGVCIDVISVYNKMLNNCLLYASSKGEIIDLQYIQISQVYIFGSVKDTCFWIKEKFETLFKITQQHKTPNYNEVVNGIIKYIDGHFFETINLDVLSDKLNFNKYYICRIFKEETGINITDYINNQRIQKAKELLEDRDSRISTVSEMVGFNDATYFNRVFKKIVGISPSCYKKQYSHDNTI